MDFYLKCNSLKCRTQLTVRAVVTTCSHIFCEPCAGQLGLSVAADSQRTCPACQIALPNPDDAVSTELNPSEDYKTSILSGFSPTVIMECAGRGLAFWHYQSTQEIVYQEYLAKTLTDKYHNLNAQVDKIINDANSEIETLSQRIAQMQTDQNKLNADNATLAGALREKARKNQQIQELYDRLKRKEMTAVTQSAAFDSVDEALQSANRNGSDRVRGLPPAYGRYSNEGAPHRHQNRESVSSGNSGNMMPPPPMLRQNRGNQNHGFRLQGQATVAPHHRTRLGINNQQVSGSRMTAPFSPGLQGHNPAQRRPLSEMPSWSSNLNGRTSAESGFGMSAGMKRGSQHTGELNRYR